MILWAQPRDPLYAPLVRFITERIWGAGQRVSDGTVMAVENGGKIIGACLFHNWQPQEGVIELTGASVSPRWINRQVLRAMAGYAFDNLKCQAAVMRVDPTNTRMCRIATAFGFTRYDIPRLRGRDKAEALFVLGDDEWRTGRFYEENAHGRESTSTDAAG